MKCILFSISDLKGSSNYFNSEMCLKLTRSYITGQTGDRNMYVLDKI